MTVKPVTSCIASPTPINRIGANFTVLFIVAHIVPTSGRPARRVAVPGHREDGRDSNGTRTARTGPHDSGVTRAGQLPLGAAGEWRESLAKIFYGITNTKVSMTDW